MNNIISLYGKLGLGVNYATNDTSISTNGTNIYSKSKSSTNAAGLIAAGVEFNLDPHWGLKVEDDYYITKNSGFDMEGTNSANSENVSNFGYGNSNFFNVGAEFRF
jgi:opacity protein-like surface antigen